MFFFPSPAGRTNKGGTKQSAVCDDTMNKILIWIGSLRLRAEWFMYQNTEKTMMSYC